MAPPLAVRWRASGRAEAVSFGRADELAVRSSVAAAPGTPLEGELEVPGAEPLLVIVKVRRCRREPEGSFLIEGRLVNPTRALREVLAQGVGAKAAGEAPAAPSGGAGEVAEAPSGGAAGATAAPGGAVASEVKR